MTSFVLRMRRLDTLIVSLGLIVGFLAIPTISTMQTQKAASSSTYVLRLIESAQGGSVQLSDGTRVDIPPGALASNAILSISASPTSGLPIDAYKDSALVVREISAAGVAIKRPIKIILPYGQQQSRSRLAPDAVFGAYWDGTQWHSLGGLIDPQKKTVTFETDHLSIFALFEFPGVEELLALMRLSTPFCNASDLGAPKFDSHWTEIANAIARANSTAIPGKLPTLGSYDQKGLGDFRSEDSGAIIGDSQWLLTKIDWLPKDKSDLLLQFIIAHELSHIARGESALKETAEELRDLVGISPTPEFLASFGAALMDLRTADQKGDCEKRRMARTRLEDLALEGLARITRVSCAGWQQRELNADLDGVSWARQVSGDAHTTGVLAVHFLKVTDRPDSCSHPSDQLRARQIASGFAMGSNGGMYGTVSVAGISPLATAPGQRLENVQVTVDGRSSVTTDSDGKFLITGIFPGDHSVSYAALGYQTTQKQITVATQDLVNASAQLAWLPAQNQAPPTATLVPPQPPSISVPPAQPPVISVPPPPPPPAPPVYAPPTAVPPPPDPSISFRAEPTTITYGNCSKISWDVDNAREVYFDGYPVSGHNSTQICPHDPGSESHTLTVIGVDGKRYDRIVTIAINAPQQGSPPAAPSNVRFANDVIAWNDNSNNEDGFRITIRRGNGQSATFDVGANATSLSQNSFSYCGSPVVQVVAFNRWGTSPAASIQLSTGVCVRIF